MGRDATRDGCRLVLIEGIPGSGKSTTARWLAEWLTTRGIDAMFVEELHREHPVVPRSLMRTARESGYVDRCVDAWRRFADAHRTGRGVVVLDACFFQATVRFLLEHDHPSGEPMRYLREVEHAIAGLRPRLVYLAAANPRHFLEREFEQRKGEAVVAKIAAYSETTACSRRNGWKGLAGCVELYLAYRRLCDGLVASSSLPRLELDSRAPREQTRAKLRSFFDPGSRSDEVRVPG